MSANWAGKKVLVTGGTGFVGSFLAEELLSKGAHVRIPIRSENYRDLSDRRDEIEWMDGDLRNEEYCTQLLRGIDHVFHMASQRRNVAFHRERCSDVLNGNVQMSLALIKGMRELADFPSVTFFSTANVPPTSDVIALAQEKDLDGYVVGKAVCETLWFAAKQQHDFPLLIVRPVGVYGPRDTFSLEGNVIPSLMIKARDSKDDQLSVWGSGKQERSFLYVTDLVKAVMCLIDNDVTGIQYIVPKDSVTVKELAELVRDTVNPGLKLTFDTSKPEGARSIARLPSHPCFDSFAWTSLHDGLTQTMEWWNKTR